MNIKDPGSRLLIWRIKLEEYNYEIVYKKCILNMNADALRRINGVVLDNKQSPPLGLNHETKKQILYEFHDAPLGGIAAWGKKLRCNKREGFLVEHETGNRRVY
jgi:hypothetical protein